MSCQTPLVAHAELHDPGIAFRHPLGEFTARKERKQRGDWYWVAYRQVHGKLHKAYPEKSEALTEAHLCAAAQELGRAAASSRAE